MKAIVQKAYGSPEVLELTEIDKPGIGDHDVSVRVHAAGVHRGDWLVMRGLPYIARLGYGLLTPKHRVPGMEVAGSVEAVGKSVTRFRPGDEVFGWCNGAFAEYVPVSEDALAMKPGNITLEQAAAFPISAFAALQALRDTGQIQPRHTVLIIGASGGVGTFAVQIAKSYGAEVTGVCSAKNVDMVRSIGADRVIDYGREDLADGERRYDLILDTAGNRSLSHLRRALTRQGTLVIVGGSGGPWLMGTERTLRALVWSPFVGQRLRGFLSQPKKEDLAVLKALIEAGKVTPVIDKTYPLREVPEAMRYLEERHPGGKLVITISS
jgi:NADPH:quinone reductase-like Zn-dependent oxidoreductase